jgi:chromosome segregation protein
VRFEAEDTALARGLLGTTAVVEDLPTAVEMRLTGPRGFRYVTHDGEVMEADGTVKAGPLSSAMGLLSRRSELDAIAQQIAEVDGRIERLTRQLADDSDAAKQLEEQINGLRNAIYASNTAKVQATGALAQNSDQQNALKREQPVLERELQSLAKAEEQLGREQVILSEKRTVLDQTQVKHNQEVEELTTAQRQAADELRRLGEELTATRVQLGQAQEKQLASSQAVQRQTAGVSGRERIEPAVDARRAFHRGGW